MCGNIFHFHFSVASGHDNADSYANMNYLWEYFSAAFFFCCIQPYSVTTLKAISDFIILHKTKKNDYFMRGKCKKSKINIWRKTLSLCIFARRLEKSFISTLSRLAFAYSHFSRQILLFTLV